jgi:prepilin-type N-terminal cleavage/methylation domain-containing protein
MTGKMTAPIRPAVRPPRAFSLLEVLVAMSILSLLLVLLLSVTNNASKLWRANENRVDSYREARAAINTIANDLGSLCVSTNTAFFAITPTDGSDSDLPKVTNGAEKAGMDGKIFFLTALPPDAQESGKNKSDLCTVGYFLAYDKTSLTGKGAASYNLYRYFRSSDATFAALETGKPLGDVDTDTSTTASQGSEVLAKNITGFKVNAYTIVPPADPANLTPTKEFTDFQKSATTPLPDVIEITIEAINNETAKRFGENNKGAWEDPDSLTRKQSERAFTTRIHLPGAATVKPMPSASPSPSPTPTP